MAFQPPAASDSGFDAYVSDPSKPVPYRARPILPLYGSRGSTWSTWLVDDQRFAQDRPDVMAWETAPLEEDLVIAGNVIANLFASTSGSDADWVVKLIDVYPEQYEPDPKLGGNLVHRRCANPVRYEQQLQLRHRQVELQPWRGRFGVKLLEKPEQ